jgi:hypothetical protein
MEIPFATQKFMGFIQDAQPQVRFLELGREDELIKKLGRNSLDIDAVKAIENEYGVSSIFTGHFEISNVIPDLSIGTDLSSIRASAVVKISMVSRHLDTVNGATIWSNSRQGQWKVAGPLEGGPNGTETPCRQTAFPGPGKNRIRDLLHVEG